MKYITKLSILLIALFNPTAYSQTLPGQIDTLIEEKLPHATVGVFIKNARTGQIIYSKNADKLLTPASSTKLFTAAAALYYLPHDYHFSTQLAQSENNYYVAFSGAPDFTIEHLLQLLSMLKDSGTKAIAGNIVLDVSCFKEPYYSRGISYDDLGWYYSAPETALILNENAVDFDFITGKKIGSSVQVLPKIPNNGLTIINEIISVDAETEQNHCALHVETLPNNTVRLFGCLAIRKGPVTMHLAVPDPILLAKQMIHHYLESNNIALQGQIILGKTPATAKILSNIESNDLTHLLSHMLKNSDNLYANSITRLLGYKMTGEGSTQQGAFAIKKILAAHTHLDLSQVNIADGMGTRYNLATSRQIEILLSELYQDKLLQTIILNILPQAGVSGNLKNRMQKTNLDKIAFAKTGTMHDVSSLSGYIVTPKSDPLIFSIMINGINMPISTAKGLEEEILERVVASIVIPAQAGNHS